ncbi:hypothetical protein PR202_gb26379 [Eleusine coracana subsp. coracana]|uniref:Uncharacterized protein n=1 Tax=Eleusine coracana subsp. coracana TaxID=191504 RepID=A0AAV5FT49_ELECO|nr:hypothetical protein QOZ80_1BG0058960 [Eleusine coracana subsp. coracana]GJN37426.1 hypothetical protein PR202_gb26379 [Eleusine coracana subsp. coracana]
MDASSVQTEHHSGGTTSHPRSIKNRRRPLLGHLNVQVPAVGNASIFHPSPKSSSHADRPASPSLLRSPSAWIRASFGSSKHMHTPRPPKNFCYDARSYAQNFDEGGSEEDMLMYRCLSPRLPTSPRPASQSRPVDTSGRDGNGTESAA